MKYGMKILILLVFCLLGFLFSEKPNLELKFSKKSSAFPQGPMKTEEIEIKRHPLQTDNIMGRNLFTVDGKYTDKIEKPPENPYKLVGVIIGEKKMAIFKDYTGTLFIAKERERMIDGYTVETIGENFVVLKRGKQQKEMRILSSQKQEAR
jgi:hypothetical protein